MGSGHTPIHHEFLGRHSRGHSLVSLDVFLLVFVCVVFLDESVKWVVNSGQVPVAIISIRTLCPGPRQSGSFELLCVRLCLTWKHVAFISNLDII